MATNAHPCLSVACPICSAAVGVFCNLKVGGTLWAVKNELTFHGNRALLYAETMLKDWKQPCPVCGAGAGMLCEHVPGVTRIDGILHRGRSDVQANDIPQTVTPPVDPNNRNPAYLHRQPEIGVTCPVCMARPEKLCMDLKDDEWLPILGAFHQGRLDAYKATAAGEQEEALRAQQVIQEYAYRTPCARCGAKPGRPCTDGGSLHMDTVHFARVPVFAEEWRTRCEMAESVLSRLGWTHAGGNAAWKPPIGIVPGSVVHRDMMAWALAVPCDHCGAHKGAHCGDSRDSRWSDSVHAARIVDRKWACSMASVATMAGDDMKVIIPNTQKTEKVQAQEEQTQVRPKRKLRELKYMELVCVGDTLRHRDTAMEAVVQKGSVVVGKPVSAYSNGDYGVFREESEAEIPRSATVETTGSVASVQEPEYTIRDRQGVMEIEGAEVLELGKVYRGKFEQSPFIHIMGHPDLAVPSETITEDGATVIGPVTDPDSLLREWADKDPGTEAGNRDTPFGDLWHPGDANKISWCADEGGAMPWPV